MRGVERCPECGARQRLVYEESVQEHYCLPGRQNLIENIATGHLLFLCDSYQDRLELDQREHAAGRIVDEVVSFLIQLQLADET